MWSREVRAARLLRRDEIHELDPHLVWIEDNAPPLGLTGFITIDGIVSYDASDRRDH